MKHADIIDRLKAGSGSGRGRDDALEAEIVAFLNDAIVKPYPPNENVRGARFQFWSKDGAHFLGNEGDKKFKIHGWLTSLDACIGLMKEVLPEYFCDLGFGDGKTASVILLRPAGPDYRKTGYGSHDDLCRAFLIAILSAMGEAG